MPGEDKIGVFDFVNSISFNKIRYSNEEIQKFYDPYITIMAFANYPDTIFIANALNCFKTQPTKKHHFLFLFEMIRKKKRFSQFYKKEAEKKQKAEIVSAFYNCSLDKAEDCLHLLKDEDIQYMKSYMNDFGGKIK